MSRTLLTSTSSDATSDDGNVKFSFIQGEQLEFPVQITFIEDLTGYVIEAVVVEGANDGLGNQPITIQSPNPVFNTLTTRVITNTVFVQFPASLSTNWATQPSLGLPVYGFFEIRLTEPSGGTYQHTFKPVRGLVEVLFSATSLVPDI